MIINLKLIQNLYLLFLLHIFNNKLKFIMLKFKIMYIIYLHDMNVQKNHKRRIYV